MDLDTLGPFRPSDAASLTRRARVLRTAPARLRTRICRLSHTLLCSSAPRWHGQSSVDDYARDDVGVPSGTLRTWAQVGRVLEQSSEARRLYSAGDCAFSTLMEIARSGSLLEIEDWLPRLAKLNVDQVRALVARARQESEPTATSTNVDTAKTTGIEPDSSPLPNEQPTADPNYKSLSLPMPLPAAEHLQSTAALAEAFIGNDVAEEDRWSAMIAEASSDVDFRVSAHQACRDYKVKLTTDPQETRAATVTGTGSATNALTPIPRLPGSSHVLREPSRVHRAHRLLTRLIGRLDAVDVEVEDEILLLFQRDAHRALGYRRFEDFAVEHLDISPRTARSRLARARLRRRQDPIHLAYARGELSRCQIGVLQQLRRLHVPASAFGPWIEAARHYPTRCLREMLAWARGQVQKDYRAWALAGFPPPTEKQRQFSAPSLEALVRKPEPPALEVLQAAPAIPFRMRLHREDLVLLVQMLASLQEKHLRETGFRPPPWWALLRVSYLARRAWAQMDPERVPRWHKIHDRDGSRCSIPTCSSRRSLEGHHIQPRSRGGGDEPENLITLCYFHHQPGVHQNLVRVIGRATRGRHSLRFDLGIVQNGTATSKFQGERRTTPRPVARSLS